MLRNCSNVRFVMAGSGDMMDKMIQLAAERGIADRFHFPGFQKGRTVWRVRLLTVIMWSACVMPSRSMP